MSALIDASGDDRSELRVALLANMLDAIEALAGMHCGYANVEQYGRTLKALAMETARVAQIHHDAELQRQEEPPVG